MGKLKTHQATDKRIKAKGKGKDKKYERRTAGQNHYNSRENGKVGRNKKSDFILSKTLNKTLESLLPHS